MTVEGRRGHFTLRFRLKRGPDIRLFYWDSSLTSQGKAFHLCLPPDRFRRYCGTGVSLTFKGDTLVGVVARLPGKDRFLELERQLKQVVEDGIAEFGEP